MSALFTTEKRDLHLSTDADVGEAIFVAELKQSIQDLDVKDLDPPIEEMAANRLICELNINFFGRIQRLDDAEYFNVVAFSLRENSAQ